MLLFFFFVFFLVFLCLYKVRVLLKSRTFHKEDVHIRNTSTPASSSSSSRSYKYDVFLSFRGEDTRKNFVDHLYKALNDRLIRTYKDDIKLPRGESVGPALLKAVEESGHAVIIFSKNYADSSWCLDELVHIMKCKAENGQVVMPVFYDVEPTEVRKQIGEFGEAFAKLTKMNFWRKLFPTKNVKVWRKALFDAGSISGWEPKNVANGHEAAVIQKIVDAISDNLLASNYSNIDEELVGMTDRVKDMISKLEIGKSGVRMVGIWGVGGGGKTTLATSVYTEIKDRFQGHCIIDSIREEASKHSLKTLQEKLLKAVLKTKVEVQSEEEGKCMIKDRLCHSNVLILLDDVDHRKQLEALAGSHRWFGDGSRIIITTRNEHLIQKVDYVSPVRLLSQDEGNRLFKKEAYNDKKPLKDYLELSLHVVSYAAGLPLALKVLGSFLYDKDDKEWMGTLARLKNIPESEILEKLKLSYDGLDTNEKELFLDIACYFRRRSRHTAMEILDACGFCPNIGIKVLIQKALITINSDDEFDMHDLIQEMAHFIIRGEHPDNPEKHSRVWKYEEIRNMCIGDATMENDKIEAIGYYRCRDVVPSHFLKFVSNLKKLRWIHVTTSNKNYVEGPNFLSNELRYIKWENYPASPFPDSFQPMNLLVLKMDHSFQMELWRSHKLLPKLKVLQLSYMKNLVSTPDFDGLPYLQNLKLVLCDDLEMIHPSIGNHRSLKNVEICRCRNLRMFPTILNMEKLERLVIYDCHESLEFPDIEANMVSLVDLSLYGVGIGGLLSSIGERCTSLISLHLFYCYINKRIEIDFDGLKDLKDFQIHSFIQPLKVFPQLTHRLQRLHLVNCHLKDGEVPSVIGKMSNLQELNLMYNDFSKIHFNIWELTRLKLLNLSGCKRLLELPQLPSSIAILMADYCVSLTDVGDFYVDCKRLRYASLICPNMVIDGKRFLQSMLEGGTAENQCVSLKFRGLEIPKGFTPCLTAGLKCTLQLPVNWCSYFCGFLICLVAEKNSSHTLHPTITMRQVRGGSMGVDSEDDDVIWKESGGDESTWVFYIPFDSLRHTDWWDSASKKVSFSFNEFLALNPCRGLGVGLVDRKGGSGPIETSPEISTDSSEFFDKISGFPRFKILHDSINKLVIDPLIYDKYLHGKMRS